MRAEESGARSDAALAQALRRLPVALLGNALMRIAGGASGVLVGLYLASLANAGRQVDAVLVGTLGAVSFVAELLAAVPMGMLSDAIAPRALMTGGALLGAAATQMFGMSGWAGIFFLSRAVEGLGAAAGVPPLLAHITDVTEHDPALRARAMSYFELSLLAGLALGGLIGAQLWHIFHTGAFAAVASVYLLCAGLLYFGAAGSRGHGGHEALAGLTRALRQPSLRRLAPVWLCVNSIVGLWLGPTLTFLLAEKARGGQFLDGIFADEPERIGTMLLGYSLVFAAGVSIWSVVLPRMAVGSRAAHRSGRDVRRVPGAVSAESRRQSKLRRAVDDRGGDGAVYHGRERVHSGGSVAAGVSDWRAGGTRRGDGRVLRAAEPGGDRRFVPGGGVG